MTFLEPASTSFFIAWYSVFSLSLCAFSVCVVAVSVVLKSIRMASRERLIDSVSPPIMDAERPS